MRPSVLTAALLLLAGPAAVAGQVPDTFTNLQVLPKTISRDSLVSIMRNFSFALGVRCQYCHVGGDGISFEGVRFADDSDEDKQKARYMLRMVDRVNGELLANLPQRDQPPVDVQCVTCHGGLQRPRTIEAVVLESAATAGVDSAVALYRRLRADYFGTAAFDFRVQRLMEVARAFFAQQRLADAQRMLELNAEFNPMHTGNLVMLADIRLLRADTAGAVTALQKVLELNPRDQEAQRKLSQIRPLSRAAH